MTYKRNYTEEIKNQIKKLYLENNNTVQISNFLNISQSGVERYLKKEGLYKKINSKIKISENQYQDIFNMWTDGLSSTQIANFYNVSSSLILKILKKNGFDTSIANRRDLYSPVTDLNYFQTIDTETKAWLLGFIFADGNITIPSGRPNSHNFQLEIQERDIEVLNIFCDEIGYPKEKIKKYSRANRNTQKTVKVSFYSNTFCQHLKALGCVPNKTHILQYPDIPCELNRHFIRGLIDGDGRVFKTEISLFGNKEMISSYCEKIITEAKINPSSIKKYKTTCYRASVFQKNERLKLINYLYKDSKVFLKRKAYYYLSPVTE